MLIDEERDELLTIPQRSCQADEARKEKREVHVGMVLFDRSRVFIA